MEKNVNYQVVGKSVFQWLPSDEELDFVRSSKQQELENYIIFHPLNNPLSMEHIAKYRPEFIFLLRKFHPASVPVEWFEDKSFNYEDFAQWLSASMLTNQSSFASEAEYFAYRDKAFVGEKQERCSLEYFSKLLDEGKTLELINIISGFKLNKDSRMLIIDKPHPMILAFFMGRQRFADDEEDLLFVESVMRQLDRDIASQLVWNYFTYYSTGLKTMRFIKYKCQNLKLWQEVVLRNFSDVV